MSRVRVGIDIGGTFTDLVLVDGRGERVHIAKVLTTPDDPAEGALAGLKRILGDSGIPASGVEAIVHATTLVANALIERKGAPTGLITTEGFTDTLGLAREKRFDLYDIFPEIPEPLIPREMCAGVSERTDAEGRVSARIDSEEIAAAAGDLRARGARSIAINFLHAPANPENEAAAEAAIRERFPDLFVSRSSAVAPETGEYERCSTVAANAYVQPIVDSYLDRIQGAFGALGFGGEFSVMLSTGGFAGAGAVRRAPVRILESGPAGGAIAAARIARALGEDHALGFDMGGTTAKICLVHGGEPATVGSFEAARTSRFQKGSGLPILAPSVDLAEIGAGGGSIARLNRMGLLQVGPRSAGAEPGPACYGRGGSAATVTDANLLLGYLNPAYFLGGRMPLSAEAARRAIEEIAGPLGMSVEEAARGIHEIVTEQMAAAARVHIAEKGADPRRYVLIATGGAGPAHACLMARKLHIARVVCPPAAGVASAVGLLMARPRSDVARAFVSEVDAIDWERVDALFGEMRAEAREALGGAAEGGLEFRVAADMRYRGQADSVTVPVPIENGRPAGAGSPPGAAAGLKERFEEAYLLRYMRKIEGVPVEMAAWRLTALGERPGEAGEAPALGGHPALGEHPARPHLKGERRMLVDAAGEFAEGAVYDRYALPEGEGFAGPAVIEEREASIFVPSGASFQKDAAGNIRIALEG